MRQLSTTVPSWHLCLTQPWSSHLPIPQLVETYYDLPVIKDLPSDPSVFTDPKVPVKYLGLCSVLQGAWPLVAMWKPRSQVKGVVFLINKGISTKEVGKLDIKG